MIVILHSSSFALEKLESQVLNEEVKFNVQTRSTKITLNLVYLILVKGETVNLIRGDINLWDDDGSKPKYLVAAFSSPSGQLPEKFDYITASMNHVLESP